MDQFISYGKQWIDDQDIQAVVETLKSSYLTQGPKIEEFEKSICDYTGAKFCVVVSNGTAALHLAVAALELESQSEGITSPNTFVASSNCLIYNGLKPVFADIDPQTYNINPEEINKKITAKTKVLIPVHFAGQPATMEEIFQIAKKNSLKVIEDAAHAIGSSYKNGTKVGNCQYSDMTTFSFHPVKTITTGEGGAITTNSKKLYEKLKLLRSHGITKNPDELSQNPGPWYYEMKILGFNYRLTDIQAALGISQMKKLGKFVDRRREIVDKYNEAFKNLKNVTIPYEPEELNSTFHCYVIQFDFEKIGKPRNKVMKMLKLNNIGTQVHYIPVHLQPYYKDKYGYKEGDYPVTEDFYKKALSLPLYPKMSNDEVNYVIKNITNILNKV